MIGNFLTLLINYLPQILLGAAGISLVLLSVLSIVNGFTFNLLQKKEEEKKTPLLDRAKPYLNAFLIFIKNLFNTQLRKPIYFTFKEANEWLKNNTYITDPTYKMPWYLAVGEPGANQSDILSALPLEKPHGYDAPITDDPLSPSLTWWIYNEGIILDVASNLFLRSEHLSKDRRLSSILNNLNLFRAKRPIDGIILFIPVTYFTGSSALSQKELRLKSTEVAKSLRIIERKTGLKLPVYVLITGAENIGGFEGLSHSLPSEKKQEILGWSSDYTPDTLFTSAWIKKGFQALLNALTRLSLDVLISTKTQKEYRDDNLLFAPEIQKTKQGLSQYLSQIFSQLNLTEYFYLRGFYFTGATAKTSKKSDVSIFNSLKKIPLFTGDLFKKKIFAESHLANPIDQFLVSSNRRINFYKLLTLALIGLTSCGLYFGKKQLRTDVASIQSDTFRIAQTLSSLKAREDSNFKTNADRAAEFFQEGAPHVLNLIEKVKTNNLTPLLLPGSWLSSITNRLDETIRLSFDQIISRSMYLEMIIRSNNIIKRNIPIMTDVSTGSSIQAPLATTDYLVLQGFVDALYSLERNIHTFNNLNTQPNVNSFAQLVNYLYNFSYSQDFLRRNDAFIISLLKNGNFKKFSLNHYKLKAEERLYNLVINFGQRTLDPVKNYQLAIKLQKALENLDNNYSDIPTISELKEVKNLSEHFIKLFDRSNVNWLANTTFSPGYAYSEMLNKVRNIRLFDTQYLDKVRLDINVLYQVSRENLRSFGSPFTGYFLAISPSTTSITASLGLKKFSSDLTNFLTQPFMQEPVDTNYIANTSEEGLLFWDSLALDIALQVVQSYKTFLEEKMSDFTSDLGDSLRELARQSLHKNIANIIFRSQKLIDMKSLALDSSLEANTLSQVDNLIKAAPKLIELLSQLEKTGEVEAFIKLRTLVQQQLSQALHRLDKMLEDHNYYPISTDTFSWWKGEKDLALKSYDVPDKPLLKTIFAKSTEQLHRFASTYTKPLVEMLSNSIFVLDNRQITLLEKWTIINNDLDAYQKKKPDNGVTRLETFLLKEANEITFPKCFEAIPKEQLKASSANYFNEVERTIKNNIYNRCKVNASKTAIQDYETLASYFNNTLAGKFPFTNNINDQTLAGEEVSDQEIKTFFTLFDNISAEELDTMQKNDLYSNMDQALTFLKEAAEVKEFLNNYFIPQKQTDTPGLDFEITFRANQINEAHGQLVINWGLVVGQTTLERKSGSVKGRWEYGDVTAFAFRWARDSAFKPLTTYAAYPAFITTNDRAIYIYQGPWSFLRAMMLNQASVKSGALPGDDSLLEFDIPISRLSNAQNPESTAKLFVKIKPKSLKPLKEEGFKIPKFPIYAPLVQRKN